MSLDAYIGGKDPAAGSGEPTAYRVDRYRGADAVLGPEGAEETFVDAAAAGGGTVRALLGGELGRIGGASAYAVRDSRPAGGESRRPAALETVAVARRLLKALDSPGRNEGGFPTARYEQILRGQISAGDLYVVLRVLDDELDLTRNPDNRQLRRLKHMIHLGMRPRGGRRLALYITADGRLYNGPAGRRCPKGHRKILDYMLAREAYNISGYVKLVVARVMSETGGRLAFVKPDGRRNRSPPS